jgi:hypothetical protein
MNVEPSRQMKKTKPRTSTNTRAQASVSTPAQTRQLVPSRDDQTILIAKRAYELYSERGYRHGYALEDWLDAEREIVSQLQPT